MSGIHVTPSVVTLTPSPVLDRTYFVRNLIAGGVNRADSVGEELAGKGINVSRGLFLGGVNAPAVVPIGSGDSQVLQRTSSDSIVTPLWVEGSLRSSTTIIDFEGTTTRITEPPRPLSGEDWANVVALTEKTVLANGAKWVVVGGAHPIDKSTGKFVDLTELFDRMDAIGVRVALDTSGEPLSFWSRSGRAAIIKPNAEELASAAGRTLRTVGDVVAAATELCNHGIEAVLASMGSDGIIAVTKEGYFGASTAPVAVKNTVGAGDATLAGFLQAVSANPLADGQTILGVGFDVVAGAKNAVRWGAAKVQQATSGLESIENLPESFLNQSPDLTKLLDEPAEAN